MVQFRNEQEVYAYINNPANYKKTRKKQYTIWCCMPPVGTKVHNALENADYVTNEQKRFVLSGTRGEQWVIDINKLAKTYTLGDGTPITPENLNRKMVNNCIDWFQVTTIVGTSAPTQWALFIPKQYQFVIQTSWGEALQANRQGIEHGLGDFVICADADDKPNGNDRWVVNGAIFADTYNNKGWTDVIKPSKLDVPEKPKSIVARIIATTPVELKQFMPYFNEKTRRYIVHMYNKFDSTQQQGFIKYLSRVCTLYAKFIQVVKCTAINIGEIVDGCLRVSFSSNLFGGKTQCNFVIETFEGIFEQVRVYAYVVGRKDPLTVIGFERGREDFLEPEEIINSVSVKKYLVYCNLMANSQAKNTKWGFLGDLKAGHGVGVKRINDTEFKVAISIDYGKIHKYDPVVDGDARFLFADGVLPITDETVSIYLCLNQLQRYKQDYRNMTWEEALCVMIRKIVEDRFSADPVDFVGTRGGTVELQTWLQTLN